MASENCEYRILNAHEQIPSYIFSFSIKFLHTRKKSHLFFLKLIISGRTRIKQLDSFLILLILESKRIKSIIILLILTTIRDIRK